MSDLDDIDEFTNHNEINSNVIGYIQKHPVVDKNESVDGGMDDSINIPDELFNNNITEEDEETTLNTLYANHPIRTQEVKKKTMK
jgi:hypothetical protein